MKYSVILTMILMSAISFAAQANSSKFAQELECKLAKSENPQILVAPQSLVIQLTEDGNNNKLSVNGRSSAISDESLDEDQDTLTFQFGTEKIQAVFAFGTCESTRMGSVEAEAMLKDSKNEFAGTPNLSYACKCVN